MQRHSLKHGLALYIAPWTIRIGGAARPPDALYLLRWIAFDEVTFSAPSEESGKERARVVGEPPALTHSLVPDPNYVGTVKLGEWYV
jgi:hypothetical protein